jgi:DNA polymerase III alpha subunit
MSQFKTVLADYTLWFDGVVEIAPEKLEELFLKGVDPSKISVSRMNTEIVKYNRLARDKIVVKDEIDADKISFYWAIPEEYKNINILDFVWKVYDDRCQRIPSTLNTATKERVTRELREYESRGLLDVLKVLIYTVDMFKKNNVVWGVGRGSSCASYILFLLEVHSVDSIKYEIPLEEFFK